MPKISVLMPIYNTKEKYLRPAIESVLTQTFEDFELLILNDGSPQAEPNRVVQSYKDSRLRYIPQEANRGISAARNALISLAAGAYLAVMDHDDVCLPRRLEQQAAYLDAHPDVGVVGARVKRMAGGKMMPHMAEDLDIKVALSRYCVITHPAAMIRKSVLETTGLRYDAARSPAEDYDLWCRLIPHTRFHNLSAVLLHYREHDGRTSERQKEKMAAATAAIRVFMRMTHPELYEEFLRRSSRHFKAYLFGFLPFLRAVRQEEKIRISLFGLCVLSVKFKDRPWT